MPMINKSCLRPPHKRANKRWSRPKNVIALLSILFTITWLSGLDLILREKSFSDFVYPLDVDTEEFQRIVTQFRSKGKTATTLPINTYYSSITFSAEVNRVECGEAEQNYFLILVKSAPQNWLNRQAIRETWKKQGIQSGVTAKTLFFMGNPTDPRVDFEGLKLEQKVHKDIVRIDYLDNYYNNTIKTVLEMRFAAEHCPNFNYAFLVDDDYFVNLKNLYKFTLDNAEEKLYAGFTFSSKPLRHRFFNKWFIDLEEYPYSHFPHYVTAGNILLSKPALMDIYYSTFYVKPFRFDDIYVSICAKKLDIPAIHSDLFKFWVDRSESSQEDLIAAHGYGPARLMRFWKVQKEAGWV